MRKRCKDIFTYMARFKHSVARVLTALPTADFLTCILMPTKHRPYSAAVPLKLCSGPCLSGSCLCGTFIKQTGQLISGACLSGPKDSSGLPIGTIDIKHMKTSTKRIKTYIKPIKTCIKLMKTYIKPIKTCSFAMVCYVLLCFAMPCGEICRAYGPLAC